jgi:transposase InsO family protein
LRVGERYELARELRERYAAADRGGKAQILDAFCLATGYGRKHAIKVLRGRRRQLRSKARQLRRRTYGLAFRQALKVLWEASGYICSERLQPFLPDLLPLLERHGQLVIDDDTRGLLLRTSVATVERNLVELRRGLVARKMSQTKPGSLLRRQIPVVVGQWKALDRPGYLEIDLVSHSGEHAAGRWIYTLCATDLSTGWTERIGIMGNSQATVIAALEQVRQQLPFPLLGIHPDSGGEFINWQLFAFCEERGIAFSRSRPRHKNDNAHVEQKNWTLVRRLIGYQRLDTPSQLAWLNQLYTELLRPYNNCFQPVMKLIKRETAGQRVRKVYDRPTTPLQRVLLSGQTDAKKVSALVDLYSRTSPLTLKRQIDRRLAAMPAALEVSSIA